MKNEALNLFGKKYKVYLMDTGHSKGTADSYYSYVRNACKGSGLGLGILEAIASISDSRIQEALCEFVVSKLIQVFESGISDLTKKDVSNYKSGMAALQDFIGIDSTLEDKVAVCTDSEDSSVLPVTVAFSRAIALPYDVTYTRKELSVIFGRRLVTQDRFYENECFPARVIQKINNGKRKLYRRLIDNTKFLVDNGTKAYKLKEISKLIIKTDGYVQIEVKGILYDVYTEVFTKGVANGFELIQVNSVKELSLDHDIPISKELPIFLSTHKELDKLSRSVISHRRSHPKETVPAFSADYFNNVYNRLTVSEDALLDETEEFINRLSLTILHRSYNSSKSNRILPAPVSSVKKHNGVTADSSLYISFKEGFSSFANMEEHATGYCIDGNTLTVYKSCGFVSTGDIIKKISDTDMKKLISLMDAAKNNKLFGISDTCIHTVHATAYSYDYNYCEAYGKNCRNLFEGETPEALSIQREYDKLIDKLIN